MEINFFIFFARSKIVQARFVLCSYCWTGLTGLELIRIVFIEGKHGQAKLDRGTQISTVAGEKIPKKVGKMRKKVKKGQRGKGTQAQMGGFRLWRVNFKKKRKIYKYAQKVTRKIPGRGV